MFRRLRPLSFLAIFLMAFSMLINLPAYAAMSLSEVSSGTNSTDAATYTIPSVSLSHDARLALYVTSGRTDGTAAKASSVSGFGATWQELTAVAVTSGNLNSAVYTAQATQATDAITLNFPAVQQNFSWRLVATANYDDTIVQAAAAATSTTTPKVTLPAAIGTGNATLGFVSALSTSQTVTAGTGYTELGVQYTNTAPTIRGAAEWRTDGSNTVGFTTSGTTQKAVIVLEIAPAIETPPDPAKSVRVAVIGDSLTYQDGLGEANISQTLVDDGYGASNIYVYGIGGKKITAKDSRGKTTVQNIAEARAKLTKVDIWVIALGTNNVSDATTTFTTNVNTILDAIGPNDKVVWVGLGFYRITNSNAAKYNPLLQSAVNARANGSFADWNSFIHNGRDETGLWIYPTDSTHMTQTGYAIRNQFYLAQLDTVYAILQQQ